MDIPAITFIGGGNMATSIIGGLIAQGFPAENITACDPVQDNLDKLENSFGINTSTDNNTGVAGADAVLLAVKPQVMKPVCEALADHLASRPVLISIAAGIPIARLSAWLGGEHAIIRCMPNTPALVQEGASGVYANNNTSDAQKAIAEEILTAVGLVKWLEREELLNAVTAISGSGPAYFFLFMEEMIKAGTGQGLEEETARVLAIQTCIGAGMLAQSSDVEVAELRRRVCSPGGTTLKAIESFTSDGLEQIVERAMQACADRAVEMAREFE